MTGHFQMMDGYSVGINDFTARQQRILIELARGSSMKSICRVTGLAAPSVRAMVADICLFLGASDTANASRWMLEQLDRAASDE